MKTYETTSNGAVEGITLWPAAEIKTLYAKTRQARSNKQLSRLVWELGQYMAYSEITDQYPDEGLAEYFTELPLGRRVEIIQKETRKRRRYEHEQRT